MTVPTAIAAYAEAADAGEAHAQAAARAIAAAAGEAVEITSYESLRTADGRTAVFVGCRVGEQAVRYGVGVGEEMTVAVVDAVVSGINRAAWKPVDRRVAA